MDATCAIQDSIHVFSLVRKYVSRILGTYQRQGIAFHTLDLLVKDIRKQGVSQITLEATEMGRPLYEKSGFVKMEDEMELIK